MSRTRHTPSPRHKTVSRTGVIGQKGVNLIERIVLDMESRWTPSGPNEVGIDGYVELFDPATHKALGLTLAAQSKVLSGVGTDAKPTFNYRCTPADVQYWLAGNMPVILVVSDPAAGAAWWVSIKRQFKDWIPGNSTTVTFTKATQCFTKDSFNELVSLAAPTRGLYLAPPRKIERLHSNLLPIHAFPNRIHIAATECRRPRDVWALLGKAQHDPDAGWVLKEKRLISFHDISKDPWTAVCDQGSVETFPTTDWAESADRDRQHLFVQLLNQTLRGQLHDALRYWPKEDCFAMIGPPRRLSYPSLKRRSRIAVVSHFSRTATDGRVFETLRHLAFRGHFRRFEKQWCLEITPTYRFTRDGYELDRFHSDRLKGIKRFEGNRAVLSTVLFWAHFLRPDASLFATEPPPIQFGELLTFESPVGIDDKRWLTADPESDMATTSLQDAAILPDVDDLFTP